MSFRLGTLQTKYSFRETSPKRHAKQAKHHDERTRKRVEGARDRISRKDFKVARTMVPKAKTWRDGTSYLLVSPVEKSLVRHQERTLQQQADLRIGARTRR